jgi:hypothetical protein
LARAAAAFRTILFAKKSSSFAVNRAYNPGMARGWESKAVEEQIEAHTTTVVATGKKPRTAAQVQQIIAKRNLETARAKVRHEIASTENDRYKQMLTRSLLDLDRKIAEFK